MPSLTMRSAAFVCPTCRRALASQQRAIQRRTLATTTQSAFSPATIPRMMRISSRTTPQSFPVTFRSRPFGTFPPLRKAILNPREDEDGNEMLVDITPRAAHRLSQIMKTDSNPDLALRISVESGGCHGFQYLMSLTDMSKVSQEDDTVFEGKDGAKVVLDEPSLELLKGSKVDYTMELIGSQFKIVDNPHATSSCGCGTSFDIKA